MDQIICLTFWHHLTITNAQQYPSIMYTHWPTHGVFSIQDDQLTGQHQVSYPALPGPTPISSILEVKVTASKYTACPIDLIYNSLFVGMLGTLHRPIARTIWTLQWTKQRCRSPPPFGFGRRGLTTPITCCRPTNSVTWNLRPSTIEPGGGHSEVI